MLQGITDPRLCSFSLAVFEPNTCCSHKHPYNNIIYLLFCKFILNTDTYIFVNYIIFPIWCRFRVFFSPTYIKSSFICLSMTVQQKIDMLRFNTKSKGTGLNKQSWHAWELSWCGKDLILSLTICSPKCVNTLIKIL